MANKTFQGRIVQKHDTKANWDKATNFIPLKGEIIIYDDLKKIKIGDGTTKVGNLAFINDLDALAKVATSGSYNDLKDKPTIPTVPTTEITANTKARHTHNNKDVLDNITGIVDMDHISNPVNQSDLVPYEVFQATSQMILDEIPTNLATVATSGSYDDLLQKPTIGDGEVSISYRNSSGGTTSSRFTLNDTRMHNINIYTPTKLSEFTNDTNYATQDELTNATAGLTGAMHFIGAATVAIADHATTDPVIDGYDFSAAKAGDVILYNHLEFVWDGTKWEQLGDESSYVLKTQKINSKVLSGDVNLTADDVNALPITGGKLKGDLEIPTGRILKIKDVSIKGSSSGNSIYLDITNDMSRGTIITGVAGPDRDSAVANKEYVDTKINTVKESIPAVSIITWADNGT